MTTDPRTIAAGLSDDDRRFVSVGSWVGTGPCRPEVLALNALELIHIHVLKDREGRIGRWKARLTPLGLAVRAILMEQSI